MELFLKSAIATAGYILLVLSVAALVFVIHSAAGSLT